MIMNSTSPMKVAQVAIPGAESAPREPAATVLARHGDDLRQLGATEATPTGPSEVTVRFDDQADARLAAGVLRDTVDGVALLVAGPGGDASTPPSHAELTQFATRLDGIMSGDIYEGARMVTLWATSVAEAGRLQPLIRPTFGSLNVFVEHNQTTAPLPHGVGVNEG